MIFLTHSKICTATFMYQVCNLSALTLECVSIKVFVIDPRLKAQEHANKITLVSNFQILKKRNIIAENSIFYLPENNGAENKYKKNKSENQRKQNNIFHYKERRDNNSKKEEKIYNVSKNQPSFLSLKLGGLAKIVYIIHFQESSLLLRCHYQP